MIIEQNKSKDETRLNSMKPKCDDLRAKVEDIKSKLAEQEGNTTQLFIEVQRAKKQIETLQFGMVDINKEMAVHRYQILIDPATERLLSSSTGLGTVIEMSSSKDRTLNCNHLVEPDSEKQIPGVTTKVINQVGVESFQDDGSSGKLTEEESQDSDNMAKAEEQNCCPICLDNISDPKKLICGHVFCTKCIDMCLEVGKKVCPICFTVVGKITGDQPSGTMTVYSTCDPKQRELIINYNFPNGRQESRHPPPRQPFRGSKRTAYLPDNEKGRTICRMLKVAFRRKLVFTTRQTKDTSREVITWNDIHHKTDHGPFTLCGYADPSYLERVTGELKAKGITEEDIDRREPIDGTIYA
ncbi:E3 ubiquitin-protein ligase DTX3L-like [Mya arenaria]|uniref:E3 ubiquitin-protein ligase DTX3L-like n=1 Tax=Mya arenaria TaxID=6604 RepID=UPI0022E84392|nr:E3 ubiquitin-protein ligase DTX3L-like [Mya arenaria]